MTPDADERQEKQFETWLSGKGIPFLGPEAEEKYKWRETQLKDAIQLKKPPRRVPVCPSSGFFPLEYAGITFYDAMYDCQALSRAWKKFQDDFAPDTYNPPTTVTSGRICDLLDFKLYRWPGHGLPNNRVFQFVEGEYMTADEYQDLIDDPSGFSMHVYLPRIFGSLKAWEKMPLLPIIHEMHTLIRAVLPFGLPDVQTALQTLTDAGSEALQWLAALSDLNASIMGKGYPCFSGGITLAPFDTIGDTMRGTAGVMMDMYRRPDELLEACERLTPLMIKRGMTGAKANEHSMIFIPLHKGADDFMSDKHFQTFYWPTLKKVIIGLINEGFVPQLFAEGSYNSRLEIISELPKGKTVWWFDQTEMARAKETVGKVACLAGNVPLSLLCTGTPDDVKAYCKNLIDVAGKDGGFILSSGAGMQGSKPANVKALIDFSKEYGIYT